MATLLGLDFGSTTCSAVIAAAHVVRNTVTGRMELSDIRETFRAELVFTPLIGERLDEAAIAAQLDRWLIEGNVRPEDIVGGGALLTGLTARRANADAIVRIIRARIGDALVASADDPCLESWLAFMGSCVSLSRRHPECHFLHLDIGGGTTNLALGYCGEVLATGCLLVGARHIRVEPGTYHIVGLSALAIELLAGLGIRKTVAEELDPHEVQAVLDYQVALLEAAVSGDTSVFASPLARQHLQVAIPALPVGFHDRPLVLTLSGGVGELVYAQVHGASQLSTTAFGDLGIDLARAIARHPRWQKNFRDYRPEAGGRATVYGLLRHSTQLSGSTLHLTATHLLPLRDLPIVGTIGPETTDAALHTLLDLVCRSRCGGAIRVELLPNDASCVRSVGARIGQAVRDRKFPADLPLVILLRQNAGKTLGQYMTQWGRHALSLLVVDEIDWREANFVHLGIMRDQTIPVSFFGLPS